MTTVTAAAAAGLLPAACSSSSPGCISPTVTLQNVALSDVASAFDVRATVLSPDGGKPLAGESVEFWAWGSPPGEESSVGISLGKVTTDASGDAAVHMPPLVQGDEISPLSGLSGTDFVRVSVDVSAHTLAGSPYCAGKARVPVTCGSAGQDCPAVSVRS